MAQCARVEFNQLFYIYVHSLRYPLSIVVVDAVVFLFCWYCDIVFWFSLCHRIVVFIFMATSLCAGKKIWDSEEFFSVFMYLGCERYVNRTKKNVKCLSGCTLTHTKYDKKIIPKVRMRSVTDHSKWCECVWMIIIIAIHVCYVLYVVWRLLLLRHSANFFHFLFLNVLALLDFGKEWYRKCNLGFIISCSFTWLKSYRWFLNSFRSPFMLLVPKKKWEKYVQVCWYHASFTSDGNAYRINNFLLLSKSGTMR